MTATALGLIVFWWTAVGLFVGSFLNVAIHRLPLEGETVAHPKRSRCPKCRHELSWRENVPVISWLVQLGKCRHCAAPISLRYPLVEILTATLWYLALRSVGPLEQPVELGQLALAGVRVIVLSGLIVATFVDFDCFEIPDEVSIGGMLLAPIAALALPQLHAETQLAQVFSQAAGEVDRLGALLGCLAGMATGWLILWSIGWLGKRVYGVDAMGFGDVKLLCAGGGFIGPGGVVAALMIAALCASVAGLGNMLRFYVLTRARARERGHRVAIGRSLRVARIAGRYIPFGPYLALGIGIVLLYWNHVSALLPW
jgi:leader peptidase (prepilin peptidase)/N-methyltransferase